MKKIEYGWLDISWRYFGLNYIKIDVIQGKIWLVKSIFDVIESEIGFMGLTPGQILTEI